MSRTVSRDQQSIVLCGDDRMSFFYSSEDSPMPSFPARMYVAPGSVFDVPAHFHLKHDEMFYVEQGEIDVTLNGVTKRYDSSSGVVTIPRGTIHSIYGIAPPDTPIITWGKKGPVDREEEFMFRNMVSVLHDSPVFQKTGRLSFTDAMQVNLTVYFCDECQAPFPALGTKMNMFISGMLAWAAKLAGYKVAYPEYVTDELWNAVKTGGGKS